MTLILVKGNRETKFFIGANKAEKTVIVNGNANTTIQTLTPMEANREVNDLLRKGWTKKQAEPA